MIVYDAQVLIRLPSSLLEEIREEAKANEQAVSVWIRRALQERLEREKEKP